MLIDITELTKADANIAGGKGSMLGELWHQTQNLSTTPSVPAGMVVPAEAFTKWMEAGGVKDENIANTLKHVGKDIVKLEEMSELLKDKLNKTNIPNELTEEIFARVSKGVNWAVRSSGIGEDAEDASFAGQHDTFLNQSWSSIPTAIKKVWLSAFNPRALYYRVSRDLCELPIRQAVVLQEMVNPEIAGVAFSADPRTGSRKRGLIEYIDGLGEDLVSGKRTPTSVSFVHTDLENLLGNHNAVLPVARTVLELEKMLEWPVDMEWAWLKDKLYLLQARPLTSLPEALEDEQVDLIEYMHVEYGAPFLRGTPFSSGQATAYGPVSREAANESLKVEAAQSEYILESRILTVPFTTPDDLPVMEKVAGVIVYEGGATSHAAIVCRELKKPCIKVDREKFLAETDWDEQSFRMLPMLINGSNGALYKLPDGWHVKAVKL